jgi:GNAT superfamily N-acetyltransferase
MLNTNSISNFFTLDIVANDFNEIVKDRDLMKRLRDLTLNPYSGLNNELNMIERVTKEGTPVLCKALMAYRSGELVGWALYSEEPSDFYFTRGWYRPADGVLFQVYVRPENRRTGIAAKLLNTAKRLADPKRLCVCPWDNNSHAFYDKFNHMEYKQI